MKTKFNDPMSIALNVVVVVCLGFAVASMLVDSISLDVGTVVLCIGLVALVLQQKREGHSPYRMVRLKMDHRDSLQFVLFGSGICSLLLVAGSLLSVVPNSIAVSLAPLGLLSAFLAVFRERSISR